MKCHEVVISRTATGATREEVIDLCRQLQSWVRHQPGFIDRTVVEAGADTWIDIVVWASLEEAHGAAAAFATAPCADAAARVLDVQTMKMHHGVAVLLE